MLSCCVSRIILWFSVSCTFTIITIIHRLLQVAAFNMGSTVVLVFQAPVSKSLGKDSAASEFKFCIKNGDRIRVGEAIGRWRDS